MARSIVLAALAVLARLAAAQSPIEFNPQTTPVASSPTEERIWSANLFGSAHAECVFMMGQTLGIVDRHAGPNPVIVTYPITGVVDSTAFGDVDGDGDQDIVSHQGNASLLTVALQTPSGFTPTSYPCTFAGKVHLADLDQDGDLDVLCGGERRMNPGAGVFSSVTTYTVGAANPFDVAPGDVDGDGDLDLVVTFIGNSVNGPGLVTRIHRRESSGAYTLLGGLLLVPLATECNTDVADMNGDGKADVVYVAKDGGPTFGANPHAFAGTALGVAPAAFTLTTPIDFTLGITPYTMSVADFDGDGRKDLAFPTLAWLATPGTGQAASVIVGFMTNAAGALQPATGRAFAAAGVNNFAFASGATALDDDLDSAIDLVQTTLGQNLRVLHNDSATAAPIVPFHTESTGADFVLTTTNPNRVSFTLTDGTTGPGMYGHLITLSVAGVFTSTHIAAPFSYFNLPTGMGQQPFAATLSTSDGSSRAIVVHPTYSFTNLTGAGQSALAGHPFANPVGLKVLGEAGQALQGIGVRFNGLTALITNSPVAYTDAAGQVSWTITAGPDGGSYSAGAGLTNGQFQTAIPMTIIGDTFQFDPPSSTVVCPGQWATVSGHLLDGAGQPKPNVPIVCLVPGPVTVAPSTTVTTASDGSFSFSVFSAVPQTVQFAVREGGTNNYNQPPYPTITFQTNVLAIAGGDHQVAYPGQTLSLPLTVSVASSCSPILGLPVTFTCIGGGLTLSVSSTTLDAQGQASTTVSVPVNAAGGNYTVRVFDFPNSYIDFIVSVRRLSTVVTPTALIIGYRHEHADVPLVLAADDPATPPLSTPWGTISTSILAPGPYFGVIDGLGIFGSIDPGMTTNTSGSWSRSFALPPASGLTFVGQMYGYDLNAVFPYDYIVSNPVTFNF